MSDHNYFTIQEVSCKCGCGFKKVQPLFYAKMNELRECLGRPVNVHSWCRCEKHNEAVGGSPTSSHLHGLACDIRINTTTESYKVVRCAGKVGFRGIGIARNFIHLDDDPCKPDNRIWRY